MELLSTIELLAMIKFYTMFIFSSASYLVPVCNRLGLVDYCLQLMFSPVLRKNQQTSTNDPTSLSLIIHFHTNT